MKKAVVSVTNDLVTDQRVQRTIAVMQDMGFHVTFVGRKLPGSLPANLGCKTRRFRLWFYRGFLFYASYNLRLFVFLLSRPYDLYLANDLDTLLPNFLVARLRGRPLVYDAHEYFTGVPEIQHRPLVKWVWTTLEAWIFPRLKWVVTVNESIAGLYENQYGIRPKVVRNISDSRLPGPVKNRRELGLPESAFILINQGAGINVERGMEEAVTALPLLDNKIHLLLVGKGDVLVALKEKVRQLDLTERVHFIPPKPYLEMLQYTLNADCGLSLDKPLSPNYRYSLPNKIFDYIKCSKPVVVSRVKEVSGLVRQYAIGEICSEVTPREIATCVNQVIEKGQASYAAGLKRAAEENNWERESEVWSELFLSVTHSVQR